jgi:hypothetical protein
MYGRREVGRNQISGLELELTDRLLSLDDVGRRFEASSSRGIILYASDFLYQAHWSFSKGELACGEPGSSGYEVFSAMEYLDELKKHAE